MDILHLPKMLNPFRRSSTRSSKTLEERTWSRGLSLYRYDSTGRVVHYGPENEIIDDDPTFQVTGVSGKRHKKSISSSRSR